MFVRKSFIELFNKFNEFQKLLMILSFQITSISHHFFFRYFFDCPVIHVEGRTFPVKEVFLSEILKVTNFRVADAVKTELETDPAYQSLYSKKEIRSSLIFVIFFYFFYF